MQAEGPVQQFRISGLVKFGSVSTLGGATLAGFDLPTAQQTLRQARALRRDRGRRSKPGVDAEAAPRDPVDPACRNAQARTGEAQAAKDAKDTDSFISFLRGFLLAFGGIALFVGSFVIANSLSITIAQRTREFATLRTLGASRRQVLTSIFVESLVIGRPRVGRRAVPRPRAREGALQAVRRRRLHAAEQRPRLRHSHGDHVAARRDHRHADREHAAGDPRDARAADRRRARGRDAAAVAVRALPHVGLGGRDGARLRLRCSTALFGTGLGTTASCSGWASARCWSSSASRCSRCA